MVVVVHVVAAAVLYPHLPRGTNSHTCKEALTPTPAKRH